MVMSIIDCTCETLDLHWPTYLERSHPVHATSIPGTYGNEWVVSSFCISRYSFPVFATRSTVAGFKRKLRITKADAYDDMTICVNSIYQGAIGYKKHYSKDTGTFQFHVEVYDDNEHSPAIATHGNSSTWSTKHMWSNELELHSNQQNTSTVPDVDLVKSHSTVPRLKSGRSKLQFPNGLCRNSLAENRTLQDVLP